MSRIRLALPALLLAAAAAFVLAGPALADGTSVVFPTPVSPNGRDLDFLYRAISWPALIIFLGVEIALVYVIFKFKRRDNDHVPPQFHGNVRLEIAWFVIPTIVVAVIGYASALTLFGDFQKLPDATTQLDITVDGYQFYWAYDYPQGFTAKDPCVKGSTTPCLVVPVDKYVRLSFHGQDVIHSWWVPAITGKTDAVPGYTNYNWMKIDAQSAGKVFHGECAELCGEAHSQMQIDVQALSQADYDVWVQAQVAKNKAANASPSPSPSPAASPSPSPSPTDASGGASPSPAASTTPSPGPSSGPTTSPTPTPSP